MMKPEEIARLFKTYVTANGIDADKYSDEFLAKVVSLVKGRICKGIVEQTSFLLHCPDGVC